MYCKTLGILASFQERFHAFKVVGTKDSHTYLNKTKGTLVPGREQLDMIYDSVCLHFVVLDSIYLDFVCLISFSLIVSVLIVSALLCLP